MGAAGSCRAIICACMHRGRWPGSTALQAAQRRRADCTSTARLRRCPTSLLPNAPLPRLPNDEQRRAATSAPTWNLAALSTALTRSWKVHCTSALSVMAMRSSRCSRSGPSSGLYVAMSSGRQLQGGRGRSAAGEGGGQVRAARRRSAHAECMCAPPPSTNHVLRVLAQPASYG